MGTSFSALPNIGLGVSATQVFEADEAREWAFELELTDQPWDDEDISSDGGPSAGGWTQIQVGVKRLSNPDGKRHWTRRYGVGWFRALGAPNIVQDPGDYEAVYAGIGFETDIGGGISIGPELSVMAALREKGSSLSVVPQFNWHIIWGF